MQIDQFSYGPLTPLFPYAMSALGCLLGLLCTVRAQGVADRRRRIGWLVLGAWAIGGTGIWVAHYLAIIGLRVDDLRIRYSAGETMLSWIVAIAGVGCGLFLVGTRRPGLPRVAAGGALIGLAMIAANYTALAGLRVNATVAYELPVVIAATAVAVLACPVALWLGLRYRHGLATLLGPALLALVATATHYAGIFALRLSPQPPGTVDGMMPITFIAPILVFVIASIVVLLMVLLSRDGTLPQLAGGRGHSSTVDDVRHHGAGVTAFLRSRP